MKYSLHLCLAATLGLALTSSAALKYPGVFAGSTDFEGMSSTDSFFGTIADGDEVTFATETPPVPSDERPAHFNYASTRTTVLTLDTASVVERKLVAGGAAQSTDSGRIYADLLVKPAAIVALGGPVSTADGDQLLVYFRETEEGVTNLCVYAGGYAAPYDPDAMVGGVTQTPREYTLTRATTFSFEPDTWYRVVIATDTIEDEQNENATYAGFKVYLGGYGDDYLCTCSGSSQFLSLTATANVAGSVKSVGFQGCGSIDDFVVSTNDPATDVTPVVDFSLTWPTGYTPVSYTIGSGEAVEIDSATSPLAFEAPVNSTVAFTFKNADGISKTLTATATESVVTIDASSATFGWADYLGDAVNDAYAIDDANDLDMLRKGVASGLATTGITFVQTADIDMANETAFAGIGTYDGTPTSGTPFAGTYDGQGYKILNVDFTQRNYGGVFNQVNGGTIKNLTVSNITCSVYSESVNNGEFGFAIIGNAGNGATLTNLVAEGVFASESQPATHNVAGIVVRASAGGTGTLIKDCTNNATLYGKYTKIGGICAITQYKIAGGVVKFDGCVNNGDIISSRTTDGVTGYAGILGYNDDDSVLVNCSNTGSIVNNSGANTDKDGALVGWAYTKDSNSVRSLTDQGGNSAAKTDKMLASRSSLATVTGFQYATVDNDVATTISGSPVAGGEYLLEGAAAPVIALDDGDTIAFDTALGYTLDNTGITAAEGLRITSETVGTVTTYTTGPSIYLSPATQEIYYNCTSVVSVIGAPEGTTFYWQEEVIPGSSSASGSGISFSSDVKPLSVSSGRKADTVKFYSNTTNGTWHLTALVTNDNAQVAQLVATVTVKDVAAVVDGVEYTRTQWSEAIAAAKANDKVLGIYLSAPNATLAVGETLQVKVLATRNVVNLPTVTGPAGTDGTVYVVNKVKDSATGVTTFSLTAEEPSVMFTSADGQTVKYFDAAFKATEAGTYKLLKNISRSQLSVGTTGVVLDLNGKTFTSTATGTTAAINVTTTIGTADLTVVDSSEAGTGAIVAPNYSAIQSGKNASVAIEGGAISGKTVLVYTLTGGTAAISGGTFVMVSGSAATMLNCKDDNRGTISVTGGSFNGFDPATSNAADGNMVADGYESVYDSTTGYYTVQVAQQAIEIAPDAVGDTSYNTAEAAQAAAANVVIKPAAAVEAGLSADQLAAYKAMFEVKPVEADSAYKLTVALTSTALNTLQTQADADAAAVIDGLADGEATIATVPGFYYSLVWGSEVNNLSSETTRTLATGSTITLTVPTDENATSGFYKVKISVAAE